MHVDNMIIKLPSDLLTPDKAVLKLYMLTNYFNLEIQYIIIKYTSKTIFDICYYYL